MDNNDTVTIPRNDYDQLVTLAMRKGGDVTISSSEYAMLISRSSALSIILATLDEENAFMAERLVASVRSLIADEVI